MLYTKNCLTCGKEFTTTKEDAKFCKTKHQFDRHVSDITKPASLSCEYCGEKLNHQISKHYAARFCDKECGKKHMKSVRYKKVCLNCTEEFETHLLNQKFCSNNCKGNFLNLIPRTQTIRKRLHRYAVNELLKSQKKMLKEFAKKMMRM